MPEHIHHLASSRDSSIIAAGEHERVIHVWDLIQKKEVGTFTSVLSFGGSRLALSDRGSRCFTASFADAQVMCQDSLSGAVIWQRSDIPRIQRLSVARREDALICVTDDKVLVRLNADDGTTLDTMSTVNNVYESDCGAFRLIDGCDLTIEHVGMGTSAKIERSTFALLDASFGSEHLCISESGGPVRCLELSTRHELWRYRSSDDKHVISLAYSSRLNSFFAIEWPYVRGGEKSLIRLTPQTGASDLVARIGSPVDCLFLPDGMRLLTSKGKIYSIADGSLASELAF